MGAPLISVTVPARVLLAGGGGGLEDPFPPQPARRAGSRAAASRSQAEDRSAIRRGAGRRAERHGVLMGISSSRMVMGVDRERLHIRVRPTGQKCSRIE